MTTATATVRKHLTDVNEWHKLGEAGIFSEDSRVELIEGEILEMPPIGFNHAGHVKKLTHLLSRLVGEKAILSVQDPVQLSYFSEPEPDFMLLKPNDDFYSTRHPNAGDVLLLIEVADSSLVFDRTEKLRLYAQYGIGEYWVLNLMSVCLEVYREPLAGVYAQKMTLRKGDSVTLSQLPGISLQVIDIL